MFCDLLGYWFEWDKVELVRITVVNEVFILWRESQNCRGSWWYAPCSLGTWWRWDLECSYIVSLLFPLEMD